MTLPKIDRIRGSINVPLDKGGIEEAEKVGEAFRKAGGVDLIVCSDLLRALQTARIIKRFNSEAQGPVPTPELHPMHLGEYEGQPTKDVIKKIQALWDTPNVPAPGRAKNGTERGESTDDFSNRLRGVLDRLIDYVDAGDEKVVVVTHLRDVIFARAYIKTGGVLEDLDIESMKGTPSESPGSVFYVDYEEGKLISNPRLTKAGLYLVRHGSTKLNGS